MAQENLNTSTPNDGLGDFLRNAFIKVQNMFTELYANKVDKVFGLDLSKNDFTDILKAKLDGIDSYAQVNVQSDWDQADNTQKDYIKNKPTIPVTDDFTLQGGYTGTAQDLADLIAGVSTFKTTIPTVSGIDSTINWQTDLVPDDTRTYAEKHGNAIGAITGIYDDAGVQRPYNPDWSYTLTGSNINVLTLTTLFTGKLTII